MYEYVYIMCIYIYIHTYSYTCMCGKPPSRANHLAMYRNPAKHSKHLNIT